MKKLISELRDVSDYLSNLDEKEALIYTDAPVQDEKISKLFESVAEDLSQKVLDYDYPSEVGSHPFLGCDEKLVKKMGFDYITVCPYVGTIHNPWLMSNFMWIRHEDNGNLMIDIYHMGGDKDKDSVKNLILQELLNFKRDAKWVVEGVYDMKMMGMKYKIEKEAEEMLKKILDDEEK